MENFMEVIYKLTSPSGKYYIGRTKDYELRMKQHTSRSKTSDEIVLYRAIRKYGWNNFDKEILAETSTTEAVEVEEFFIKKYNAVKNGYNMTYMGCGGDVWEGLRDTDKYREYCELQSKLNSGENNGFFGKSHKEENKINMRHPGYQNGMYGKKQKPESIKKMKEKAKGRFTLDWFIDRYGDKKGTEKYRSRCKALSERKMKRDENGNFIK